MRSALGPAGAANLSRFALRDPEALIADLRTTLGDARYAELTARGAADYVTALVARELAEY